MNEHPSDEINLMDYFQVIRKRKWIIILGTILCMVVAGVVSFAMPKIYEAKTYLMVTSPKYQVEFASKEGSKISTPLFESISAETFAKIIINEHTARAVIEKTGLDSPPNSYTVNKILGQIKVEYPRNTNLILLKVQDTVKDRAARIANTWASVFIERNEEVISKETSDTYHFIMDQLEKVKANLKIAEVELERFQKMNKLDLLKEQIAGKIKQIVQYESKLDDTVRSQLIEKARYDKLITQILSDMELKITELEINLEKQRIVFETTKQELEKESKYIPVDKGLIGKEEINPIYISLNSKRADTIINISMLEKEKEELLRTQQVLKQDIQKLEEDSAIQKREESPLKARQPQPAKISDKGRRKTIGYTNITYKDLKDTFMKSEVNIQALDAEILQLRNNLQSLNEEVSGLRRQFAVQELIQTRLIRNVETAKSTFEILSKKGEETKITSAIKAANVLISVPATTPEFHIKPKKGQNVAIAGIIGLFASVILVFFIEFFKKTEGISFRNPGRYESNPSGVSFQTE